MCTRTGSSLLGCSPSQNWPILIVWRPCEQSSVEQAVGMQGFSVVGIILFWATRFVLPCLSLPLTFSLQVSPGVPAGFGDQVNSSFMVTEEREEEKMEEEEMENVEMETKVEGVQVEEGVRNQQVGFHNDSHGTLISKGW